MTWINHIFCIKTKMQSNNIFGNKTIKLATPIVRPRNMNMVDINSYFSQIECGNKILT